jgi:hypothetical protein
MSTIGPPRKLQRFADMPIATIPAVVATGTPAFVSIKGSVTVT